MGNYKPVLCMVMLQGLYAGLALFTKAALMRGMSPRVFMVYRQIVATLLLAPLVSLSRWKKPNKVSLGLKGFALIFLNALIGLEKVNVGSLRGIAKIIGTIMCIGGAIVMGLVKGPTLLNSPQSSSSSSIAPQNLLLGSTIQSAIFAVSIDHTKSEAWLLTSHLEIGSCIYAGIVASLSFTLQTWCVSQRGPVFSAIFNPLATVITTIIATSFLHEELYIGSLIGGFTVIIGLYVVLWGKAKDLKETNKVQETLKNHQRPTVELIIVDDSSDKIIHR
ncbi:hypothetical protein G4B88_016257 [Cannabis sativa]|uniref:WAT1-related protein n=1 Tax=Cannabis sativa TaxID=3483 RepID=A0A7J6DLL5_CANSA|nr:hypothetical protein G4B88_016257 [Cannabis sativa]